MCRHNRREVVRLTTRNRFLALQQCMPVVVLARSATLQAGGMRSFLVCPRNSWQARSRCLFPGTCPDTSNSHPPPGRRKEQAGD
jgi:hypothetical protein